MSWLHAQDVHAFVLTCDGQGVTEARRTLQTIRSRFAEWQVRAGSVGVMGVGKRGAEVAWAVIADADFAVLLDPDRTDVAKDVPEAKGKAVFVGKRREFEKPLAAWFEKFKGKVF